MDAVHHTDTFASVTFIAMLMAPIARNVTDVCKSQTGIPWAVDEKLTISNLRPNRWSWITHEINITTNYFYIYTSNWRHMMAHSGYLWPAPISSGQCNSDSKQQTNHMTLRIVK